MPVFGRDRRGTFEYLQGVAPDLGIEVRRAEPLLLDGERVSSSLVRQAVGAGDLPRLRRLLGRPYSVLGTVEEGARRGRTIGFPTANLALPASSLPPPGVYHAAASLPRPPSGARWGTPGLVEVPGEAEGRWPAVVNIGRRPTFEVRGEVLLEAHLLDFSGDLYGRSLEVDLLSRARDETRFRDARELAEQIRRDVEARRALPLEQS